ncbi:kinase [Lactarius akahatsu]|uniref:Kinase n=1 Tax=Lactarius akahatsu TaxID=416441 RepID=A0AAD4QB31_9AGAM|nr:kinase [Lactarius akahatsu]
MPLPRHIPSLYPHTEAEPSPEDEVYEDSWDIQQSRPISFATASANSSTLPGSVRLKSRLKTYSPAGSFGSPPSSASSSTHVPQYYARYHDIFTQFLMRYGSGTGSEDPRNDPDSQYFQLQRGPNQSVDTGDSDEEDFGRTLLDSSGDVRDIFSSLLESDSIEPETPEDRERLEWQTMLASVLDGDVLKSEKTRIAVALATSGEEQDKYNHNLWLGIRAKIMGMDEEEERKRVEDLRLRTVDPLINEVLTFRARDLESGDDPGAIALQQVDEVLRHLDIVHTLYPTHKALHLDKPVVAEPDFQAHRDALITWSTIFTSLRRQINVLRKWTGSETLDVTAPVTNAESPLGARYTLGDNGPVADGSTFLERAMKEESIQMTFAKGFMTTVHSLIGASRDAQVNLAHLLRQMNLPSFERELVPLISFPTQLALASLRVRLDYAQKLKEPAIIIIDQMIDDLKLNIGIACTLKRQYEAFLSPDPGGNWNLPPCISDNYDSVVLEALSFFFKLIHWKLKSGAKDIYFKETDLIESQWPTFNDVALTVPGGASVVAEQLCALTNKLMVRVTNFFDAQLHLPISQRPTSGQRRRPGPSVNGYVRAASQQDMDDEQMISWYSKILDSVRLRYRKLQRFVRHVCQRYNNSAEYTLEDVQIDLFIAQLVETDHFLVFTQTYEEEGTYIIASRSLRDHPDYIRRILLEAFHVTEQLEDDGRKIVDIYDLHTEFPGEAGYLLILSPRSRFLWNGLVLVLEIPKIDLGLKDDRVRLIADGGQQRLALAKKEFAEIFLAVDEDGEQLDIKPALCIIEQQAHLPTVNREMRKINRATNRLAESTIESVHHVRDTLRETSRRQDLLESWYLFASEHGQYAQKSMDRSTLLKFNPSLIKLAISWVSFICDDCDPNERKTFKWAVNALEFTLHRTHNNILQLPQDQFEMLRQKVASCMTLLISHFDILGARSTFEASKEKEMRGERRQEAPLDAEEIFSSFGHNERLVAAGYLDPSSINEFWEKTSHALEKLESAMAAVTSEQRMAGRVLDDGKLEDQSAVFLASFSSNISIRWQQGRFIGAGAFGSVYSAVNLDSGSLMAVKEIKFQELAGSPSLYQQIRDELRVMEMLRHPNVVEYYGIEVHRDKVYIFEEFCQGGIYTMQMLEGLAYLHSKGIAHRDIKPDNILLDHLGVIKFVDFGAAKILARNHRTMLRSRRPTEGAFGGGLGVGMSSSLTGTPMYMSPEVIKNDTSGRHGAMDIWSMGCVVLEFATGKKPWSHLDNEWTIMYHIGVATQHPPLPEPDQLSEVGINFIKACLTVDPTRRPSAFELMDHPWMLDFRKALQNYDEADMTKSSPRGMPTEDAYESTIIPCQAEKEVEGAQCASPNPSSGSAESPLSIGSSTLSEALINTSNDY